MKVSIFLPTLGGGGAERVIVTLANAIAARGFSVDLVVASSMGPYLNDVSTKVRLIDLKAGRVIKALPSLVRYLRRQRPVSLLSVMGHANVGALIAKKIARVPVRVVVSEHSTISAEHAQSKGVMAWINFNLIRLLYSSADGICAVSEEASRDLAHFAKLPLSGVNTIYNPFDLSCIKKKAADRVEHPWLNPDQPPLILSVGRLNDAKDYPTLIRAFANLRKLRALRLVILGEGELRPVLESMLVQLGLDEDAVLLPGFVSNPYAWMSRCRLFVLSSRREALPSVLIEAMACGAPIVSTNCRSGPSEILEGGRWGKLVSVGDVDSLALAMAQTLDTPVNQLPDVRQRSAHFDQQRAVDAYLQILGMPLKPEHRADVIKNDYSQA